MSTTEHRANAKDFHAQCAVLTISDTRTPQTDTSGQLICKTLTDTGHQIVKQNLVKDDISQIKATLDQWLNTSDIQVILTTGGTGISPRDTTIEVVGRLIDKPLSGFGELFRMLSYAEIGSAAMLSRAVGGLAGQTLIFAMPGSKNAVSLAMEKLILPELPHLLWERQR